MTGGPFPRESLDAEPIDAAHALLGALLVRPGEGGAPDRRGRIVEVEAYGGPEDAASHARFGPTARNRVMFGPPGIAYVYLVYGMHHCLNVVVGPPGRAAAVLIRAVEPLDGVAAMRDARAAARRPRSRGRSDPRPTADARLASGPGLVGQALGIDRTLTGIDLCDAASPLSLAMGAPPAAASVVATPRIGVDYAADPWTRMPWRLLLAGSPSVSRAR